MKRINLGLYCFFKKSLKSSILFINLNKIFKNTPFEYVSLFDLSGKIEIEYINESVEILEKEPVIIGYEVTQRFHKWMNRKTNSYFVSSVKNGKVLGFDGNIIITDDCKIIKEVSREFGAFGGVKINNFKSLRLDFVFSNPIRINNNVAIISTCGSNNFHHWNYDVLPRIGILKNSKFFSSIDFFLINFEGFSFQLEGLKLLGIPLDKIINLKSYDNKFLEFSNLIVPSFSQDLCSVNPLVINFLRETFLLNNFSKINNVNKFNKRIYLSRSNTNSRKIINENDFFELLCKYGFVEVIPEEYTMSEMAIIIANASSIVSIHGSGLSNLAFIESGTKVLDILAPYHQDPYYWMICNIRQSKYVGLFAEGNHPKDDLDLVKAKIDLDLFIEIEKFEVALLEII